MTTFEFDLSQKEMDGADAIYKVNNFILSLLAQRMKEQGMTKKKLADILEVDKSTISRMLRGNQNLTARSLGEICGALDFDFSLVAKDLTRSGSNGTRNKIVQVSNAQTAGKTLPSNMGQLSEYRGTVTQQAVRPMYRAVQ
jgi:transcriptional regulator with XRE-family HTH domain